MNRAAGDQTPGVTHRPKIMECSEQTALSGSGAYTDADGVLGNEGLPG
jgi:hypothetical protein